MKKTLGLLAILFLFALGAQAQFIGYVSPQTVQQSFGTQTCTGLAQTFNINNLGQTQHYLQFSSITGATSFKAQLFGFDNLGNSYPISDMALAPGLGQGALRGSGYWTQVQAVITCSPNSATYQPSYTGAWATTDVDAGAYLASQVDKIAFSGASESTNELSGTFPTPFASSSGLILFKYSAAGAGGSLTVGCQGGLAFGTQTIATYTLANTTNLQTFIVPDFTCLGVNLTYLTNSTTGTVSAEYLLAQPGRAINQAYQYVHITGTTATAIKTGPGFVHNVIINTGASGTVSLFDLASASCTGTPSTNTVAVITTTTSTLASFPYDDNFLNGICLKASAGMDLTVSYQ